MATKLPEDFPGLKVLEGAGVTTRGEIEQLSDDDLLALDGVGPKTLAEIRAYPWGAGDAAAPQAGGETVAGLPMTTLTADTPSAAAIKVGATRGKNGTVTTTV